MIVPAYDEQEGLFFRQIDELYPFDKSSKVKARFAGIVLKVIRDEKITFFVVSDGTATAQVTLMYRKLSPELELPAKGDSVQILGVGYKKVLGGTKNPFSFLKIFASCISRISPEEELLMCIQAASTRWKRSKESAKIQKIQKLEPINQLRTFQSPQQKIELKTLTMTYCYYVFEHNPDINSYLFNPEMIRSSKSGSQFLNDARVTKQCLEMAIQKTLSQMAGAGYTTQKLNHEEGKQPFFLMKRQLFRGIERTFEQKIIEMEPKGGVGIEQLTTHVNRQLSEFHKASFTLFDWKFSQKVLLKLQNDNKIYKTSQKLIFPNIRF